VKRLASGITRVVLSLCVAVLVLCAVFVGVARELVYEIDDFQPQIVEFINQQAGLQLELAAISGSWKGLAPRFTLHGVSVRLATSSGEPMQVAAIELEILLLKSLLSLQPRIRLSVDGAQAKAVYKDQHLVMSGFESLANTQPTQTEDSNESALDILLAQPKLSFSNSQLQVVGLYDVPVTLSVHQLQTEAGHRRRYILGDFTAHGPSDIHFSLKGRVSGSVLRQGSLNGGLFVNVDAADWYAWIPQQHRALPQASLESLQGGARFWFNFKAGVAEEIVTDFKIDDILLSSGNDIKPPHIQDLEGKARWALLANNEWRLDLQDLRLQTDRFLWMPSVVHLVADEQADSITRYRIVVDDVDIEPWVNYYLGTQSAEDQAHQILSKLRPSGKLQEVALELMVGDKQLKDYRFAVTLAGFQNRPWQFYPGLHDVEVKAWGRKGATLFSINEDYLELNYPRLFRDVITVNNVHAQLRLQDLDDQWFLQSGVINASTRDARSATQLSLSIPKDKAQPPFLQLQSTLRDGNGKNKSLYLPAGVLSEPLLEWLDEAIVDGHLMRGDVLVHGPARLNDAEPLGVLLGFTASDGVLQFLPDWSEPVRNGVADVVVDQGEVDARVLQATYYGQSLKQGAVTLPKIKQDAPHVLSVRVQTEGPAGEGFSILTGSPLRSSIGDFIDDFSLQGDMAVDFGLDIPLQSEFKNQISSVTRVQLEKGTLNLQSQNITINDLAAQVTFDLAKGLSAKTLTGKFLGGQVSGAIKTTKNTQGDTTVLQMRGNTSVAALNQWRPLSALQPLSGGFRYDTVITIPVGPQKLKHAQPRLQVKSDLKGVRVALPAPFGKVAEQAVPFTFGMGLGGLPLQLDVQYGDYVKLLTASGPEGIERSALHFGQGAVLLPEHNIVRVSGVLPRFDDAQWRPVFDKINTTANKNNENTDPGLLYRLDDSTLRVNDLTLTGYALGQTDLKLLRGDQQWQVWVNNGMATGKLTLPDYLLGMPEDYPKQTLPIVVDLERLHIEKSQNGVAEAEQEPVQWQPADVSPKVFPPVDITLGQFTVGDANFGSWKIKAAPVTNGLNIPDFSAKVGNVSLTGNAQWLESGSGQRNTTVQATLGAKNVANIVKAMGGTPFISSKTANATGELNWPGAPFEFALGRTRGDLSATLQNGVFYNVNSNAAGKLWGALNFETLMRRLQLDFDDISESEMVYDELSGNIELDQGVLNLSRVKLNSPAIKMNASGKVDVEHSTLDVGLDVALPVTRNLVLPAAVIGGVPAAATAYVVEKMFGEQFDKLTTIKYDIKGTFDEPLVTVKDSFSIIPKQVGEAVINKDKADAPPAVEATP